MTHLLKMVQVLLHVVAHPQVCVDLICNGVPRLGTLHCLIDMQDLQ